METNESQAIDVEALIQDHFQQYFGASNGLPLREQVIADSGIDSILLVTILTDVLAELDLTATRTQMRLGDIRTLEDVVALVRALLEEQGTRTSPGR